MLSNLVLTFQKQHKKYKVQKKYSISEQFWLCCYEASGQAVESSVEYLKSITIGWRETHQTWVVRIIQNFLFTSISLGKSGFYRFLRNILIKSISAIKCKSGKNPIALQRPVLKRKSMQHHFKTTREYIFTPRVTLITQW